MKLGALLGSDRPGHLFAATVTGIFLIVTGFIVGWPALMGIGAICIVWEWSCTPDVDYANRRKPLAKVRKALRKRCSRRKRGSRLIKLLQIVSALLWTLICWLWWPYGWMVSHRNKYSHSLAYGLPCRLLYAVTAVCLMSLWLQPAIATWLIGDLVTAFLQSDAMHWFAVAQDAGSTLDVLWSFIKGVALLPEAIWTVLKLIAERWSIVIMGAAIGDVVHLSKDGYSLEKMVLGR